MADDDFIPDFAAGCVIGLIFGVIALLFQFLRIRIVFVILILCTIVALVLVLFPIKLPSIPLPGTIYIINTNDSKGRECPNRTCKPVATFNSGDEITVLETVQGEVIKGNNTWLVVWHNNLKMYVHSSLASLNNQLPEPTSVSTPLPTSAPTPPKTSVYVINADGVRGRECPKLSCQPVTKFKSGDEIQVSATIKGESVKDNSVWLVVLYNNSTIYVHSSLADLKPLSATPIPLPVPMPTPRPTIIPLPDCTPPSCILREHGDNARWWADDVKKGKCTQGHTDTDWIVTYNTDKEPWSNPGIDITRIRFDAPDWNPIVRNESHFERVGTDDGVPPRIVLCVSNARGLLPEWMARKTWVWLK